jgi:hypothetical protein
VTRFALTFALFLSIFTTRPVRADSIVSPATPHIRSDHRDLLDAVADGSRTSPTFRRLVQGVMSSDVVVYLVYDLAPRPGIAARLSFLSAASGWRYVRVTIDPKVRGCQRLAILGHELQHVVEIADATSVVDARSLATWYRRIGFWSGDDHEDRLDTLAAMQAGWQVQREAARSPRHRPSAVASAEPE